MNSMGLSLTLAFLLGAADPAPVPGDRLERKGDEIMVCGNLIHTGAPVVLWLDPGGYDAYRVERRFVPKEKASFEASKEALKGNPSRFGMRRLPIAEENYERIRGGGWDLPLLQKAVDQFVIHFDVCGTSRKCFEVLHDQRGLSVHFMLDIDGTIYQTLDLKESAWHATIANSRSIGIEIANIGTVSTSATDPASFRRWYAREADGTTKLIVPPEERKWLRDAKADLRPARPEPIVGKIRDSNLQQYDLTPAQYESLTRLTAALCRTFPKLRCDYPRDSDGKLLTRTLTSDEFRAYNGVLGHYHVQTNKVDPGPAFQWDRVIDGAKAQLGRAGR